MQTQRIINAQLVNEGNIQSGELLIRNGRIESIAPSLPGTANETVFDAQGKLLFPGMIDAHVHFREPGLETKGTLHSESRAALSGGITSIMEMPNTKPAAITHEILEEKFNRAHESCLTNYSFYLGASNTNLDQLLSIDPQLVCGVKLFLGSSTGNLVVDNQQQIEEIFKNVTVPIALHCEVDQIIRDNEQRAKEKYGAEVPFAEHGRIRSRKACWLSTQYAVELAKKYNTHIHILHMTTADELEFFTTHPLQEKHITVEACPHHLWFCDEDYETQGARVKCNPAIKTAADRQALRDALKSGLIDTVGTDHAPHLRSEKENTYFEAPSGMPCVQSALPSLLEYLTPEMAAEKMAHNPATIYQCKDRGFIREGYHADLTIVDPDQPHTVNDQNILYHCGWSPFEGITFQSTVHATFVNGNLMYQDGQILGTHSGMRLTFDR